MNRQNIRFYDGDSLRFCDIWESADKFLNDYHECALAHYGKTDEEIDYKKPEGNTLKDDSITTLFYLLYSRYGGSTIASYDMNQFMYNVWAIIFTDGCTWEKKLEIQQKLRDPNLDITKGTKQIHNHALHDDTSPSTSSVEELQYISAQNTSTVVRGALEGYERLLTLLDEDVTEWFLNQFKKLFKKVVMPTRVPLYITEDEIND